MSTPPAPVPPPDFAQSVTALLELYKENTAHGRHLETQRQLVSGFVMAIGGTVVGALATLKFDEGVCFVLGLVLVGFGLLGTLFSVVQYGKWTESRERWRAVRQRLNDLCPSAGINKTIEAAKKEMETHHPRWLKASDLPLHWLWTVLNVAVLVLGIFFTLQHYGIGKQLLDHLRKPAAVEKTSERQQSTPIRVEGLLNPEIGRGGTDRILVLSSLGCLRHSRIRE